MTTNNCDNNILDLLKLHSPEFQLKSGNEALPSSELFLSKSAQRTDSLERASHASSLRVLQYISGIVNRNCVTLETGGGWSTCVFAAYSGKHVCINPDVSANEMIQRFLFDNRVSTGELVFENGTSDTVLPNLESSFFVDIAYIDGNHSFPVPIIDWHYIDLHLKKDGIVIIDDSQIRAVELLCEFLQEEESYIKLTDVETTQVFKKVAEDRVWGWGAQAINRKSSFASRLKRAIARASSRLFDA